LDLFWLGLDWFSFFQLSLLFVGSVEAISGLALLCGGSNDDKIEGTGTL
jgi:hypothetical protein